MDTHLICQVNEGLRIIPVQVNNRVHLVGIRKDGSHYMRALVQRQGAIDQPFPRWNVAVEVVLPDGDLPERKVPTL